MLLESEKTFYSIGVSYKKADVNTRGKYSLSKEQQLALLQEAKEQKVDGLFVLSTCNRTELFGFADHPYQLIQLLCKHSEGEVTEFANISNVYKNQEAVTHLFRIGTGLESQILGDYEIVGQLKLAFKQAKKRNLTNAYLERLLNLVLQASKKVKNQTKLSSGTTSVSYAAVQYILDNVADYSDKNILVFGLGKMGKHACKNIAEYTSNRSVTLINRTESKAEAFVQEYTFIKKAPIENLGDEIAKSDILIVSTGAEKPTVTLEHIPQGKELLILDLSMPENVDLAVCSQEGITLVNVDELSKVTDETLSIREQEIPAAEAIIAEHKKEFNEWLNHRRFTPAINALKASLESIQQDELNFHKKKMKDFDASQAEIVTSRFIQKITTQFVKHLKEDTTSVQQSIEVITKMFATTQENTDAEYH